MKDLMEYYDQVYGSITGSLQPQYRLSHIQNEFAPGGECYQSIVDIFNARDRICQRLGVADWDVDMEEILDAYMHIEMVMCQKMFFYGLEAASLLK